MELYRGFSRKDRARIEDVSEHLDLINQWKSRDINARLCSRSVTF